MLNEFRGHLAALLFAGVLSLPIAMIPTAPPTMALQPTTPTPGTAAPTSHPSPTPASGTPPASGPAASGVSKIDVTFLPDSTSELVVPLTCVAGAEKYRATTSVLLRNNEDVKVKVSAFRAVVRTDTGELFAGNIMFQPEALEIERHDIGKVSLSAELSGPSPAFGVDERRPALSLVGYLMATAEREGKPASSETPASVPSQEKTQPAQPKAGAGEEKGSSEKPPATPPPLLLTRPLRLTPPVPSPLAKWPVIVGVLLAAIVVIAAYSYPRTAGDGTRDGLGDDMGLPTWDGSSWATNLTALTAVFAALFNNLIKTPTQRLQQSEYNALIVLFGVLVTLAPALFNAIRDKTDVGADGQPLYKGRVWMFLVVTLVSLTAIFGETLMLAILLDETAIGRITPPAVTRLFQVTIFFVLVLLFLYSWRAVRSSTTTPPAEGEPVAAAAAAGQPLPRWHVL